ncbi:unnamed protein product, partial [Prorocentrum cordatum]
RTGRRRRAEETEDRRRWRWRWWPPRRGSSRAPAPRRRRWPPASRRCRPRARQRRTTGMARWLAAQPPLATAAASLAAALSPMKTSAPARSGPSPSHVRSADTSAACLARKRSCASPSSWPARRSGSGARRLRRRGGASSPQRWAGKSKAGGGRPRSSQLSSSCRRWTAVPPPPEQEQWLHADLLANELIPGALASVRHSAPSDHAVSTRAPRPQLPVHCCSKAVSARTMLPRSLMPGPRDREVQQAALRLLDAEVQGSSHSSRQIGDVSCMKNLPTGAIGMR